jgi:hypothetical protein
VVDALCSKQELQETLKFWQVPFEILAGDEYKNGRDDDGGSRKLL